MGRLRTLPPSCAPNSADGFTPGALAPPPRAVGRLRRRLVRQRLAKDLGRRERPGVLRVPQPADRQQPAHALQQPANVSGLRAAGGLRSGVLAGKVDRVDRKEVVEGKSGYTRFNQVGRRIRYKK